MKKSGKKEIFPLTAKLTAKLRKRKISLNCNFAEKRKISLNRKIAEKRKNPLNRNSAEISPLKRGD